MTLSKSLVYSVSIHSGRLWTMDQMLWTIAQ